MKVHTIVLTACVLALTALTAPSFAHAQSPDRVSDLTISVWPEFDDPRVLVQYDGTLAATEGYPRDVSFYVPATATLNATAYQDENAKMLNTDPASVITATNGLKLVTFKLPKPHFHLEYYHDAIKGSPDKTYDFVYHAFLATDKVNLEVQEPLKATNFNTVPAPASQNSGAHDFKYDVFNFPALNADQELTVKVSYTKTDPNPSIENVVAPTPDAQTQVPTANIAPPAM